MRACRSCRVLRLGLAVLILAAIVPFKVPRWDPNVLTSGVTIYNDRYEALPSDSLRLEEMKRDDVLFYREGLTTTVSVQRFSAAITSISNPTARSTVPTATR